MSVIAENLRRQRLPLVAIASVLLIAALAWISLAEVAPPSGTTTVSIAAPGVAQPDWKVSVSVEGRLGKLTEADKAAFNRSRPRVVELVESLYDGIFLAPATVGDLVSSSFTKEAAGSLQAASLGLPKDTSNVEIVRRSARIGLEATGSRHAAVDVSVVARGESAGKMVTVAHSSTLWLERDRSEWKVIAFEVKQRPVK